MINHVIGFSEFKWIDENLDERLDRRKNIITYTMPSYFESYCLILHPVYINQRAETEPRIPWVEMTRDERIKTARIDSPRPIQGRRIRWKQLAEENGLIFHSEINGPLLLDVSDDGLWPHRFYGPEEGSLEEPTCRELIRLLKPFTGNQTCYFEYFILATRNVAKDDQLYSGDLEDVIELLAMDTVRGSPTYWWPQDHSWCLCSDYDSIVTVLGGSQLLIDSISSSDKLETLKVGLSLDWDRDELNEKQFRKLKKIKEEKAQHKKRWGVLFKKTGKK
jgi:hypothetical protein